MAIASLRPSAAVKGGGLLQGDLIWRNPHFEKFEYINKAGEKTAEGVVFRPTYESESGETFDNEIYSIGSISDWAPSKDGKTPAKDDKGTFLVPIGKATGLSESSNFIFLLNSLKEAGFKEENMVDDVAGYEGMKCHMVRVSEPKRDGLKKPVKEGKYEKTLLVVDSVITLPGKGKGNGKAADAGDDDLSEKAQTLIMEILGDAEGPMDPMKISAAVFKRLQKDKVPLAEINAYTKLIAGKDRSFIENGPWTYEKGKASL